MGTTVMSIRELHSNFSKVALLIAAGSTIIVEKYNQPFCKITPLEEKKVIKYSKKEAFERMQFQSGDKDLSQKIDEIVYANDLHL